jgi:hypothetical protein
MKKRYLIPLVIIVVGVGAALCILFLPIAPFSKNNPGGVPVAVAPTHPAAPTAAIEAVAHNDTAILPHASETYQVMQSSSSTPKIVQATIDPLGVHVGDTQHLSVVLQDPNQIVSAEALIQTDHGTTTLKLALVGPTQVSELLPQKYYIDSQNNLAFVNSAAPVAAANGKAAGQAVAAQAGQGVALAATGGDVTYSGSWLVHDTHDTTYITTFVVKDSAGNTNSVVMAWSDACSIPWNPTVNSTVTPSPFPCAPSSIDGVENANVNISGTLTLSYPFVYNPGYNINISGGTILIGGAGVLEQGFLYAMDADGDGYVGNNSVVFSTSSSLGGYLHRYNSTPGDCDDTDAHVHPRQNNYFTTISNGGTWDYNCNGTVESEYGATSLPTASISYYATGGVQIYLSSAGPFTENFGLQVCVTSGNSPYLFCGVTNSANYAAVYSSTQWSPWIWPGYNNGLNPSGTGNLSISVQDDGPLPTGTLLNNVTLGVGIAEANGGPSSISPGLWSPSNEPCMYAATPAGGGWSTYAYGYTHVNAYCFPSQSVSTQPDDVQVGITASQTTQGYR